MSEITCRGCFDTMDKRVVRSADGTREATVDVCPTCRSVFAEEFELKVLSEALARLPFRDRPAARPAVPPNYVGCPACGAVLEKVPVSGVEVELCIGCHGVWLNAGELEALRGRAGAPAGRDPYRASVATETLAAGVVRCSGCEQLVDLSETMILPSGLVCGTCFYAREEKRLGREGNRGVLGIADHDVHKEESWLLAGLRSVMRAMTSADPAAAARQVETLEHDLAKPPPPAPPSTLPRDPKRFERACEECTAARGLVVLWGSAECIHR